MSAKNNHIRPKILVVEGLYSDLVEIIYAAGGEATEVHPWNVADVETEIKSELYDGMILTGGSDIDPRLYGEKPHKEVYGVDYVRDTSEMYALAMAKERGIPVLGICRGSQIMCAFRGGKLTQHIEGHRGGNHPVDAMPEARTFKRAIGGRQMNVISLHHQCVRRPGKGMRIAARAQDGTPEAIESKDGLWLGVQFHPEMAAEENGNAFALFQWLVRKSAEFAGGRALIPTFKEAMPLPDKYTYSRSWNDVDDYTDETWYDDDGVGWVWDNKHRKFIASDDTYRTNTGRTLAQQAVSACNTPRAVAEAKNRPAGTRPFKSAKDSAEVFATADDEGLHVCPTCAILFDHLRDRDDHIMAVHEGVPLEAIMAARYPELEPPKDHEACFIEVEGTEF